MDLLQEVADQVRYMLTSGALVPCGVGELVDGIHTLVQRSVQVYHELQELEEEDKGREEVSVIEKENQRRRETHMKMTMHMQMK